MADSKYRNENDKRYAFFMIENHFSAPKNNMQSKQYTA